MSHTRQEQMEAFGRFLDILDELRVKCPWDRKQTNESLRPNTIEETYELCDALMRDDKKDICKELGDVLSVSYTHLFTKRSNTCRHCSGDIPHPVSET